MGGSSALDIFVSEAHIRSPAAVTAEGETIPAFCLSVAASSREKL
jgi:hypothetical protein